MGLQTTLATTAIDQMSQSEVRGHAMKGMMRHLAHDLVCLRRWAGVGAGRGWLGGQGLAGGAGDAVKAK